MITTNIESSRAVLKEVDLFRTEMLIILHTSKSVVDQQTYEVFEKAHRMAVNSSIELRSLIFDVETQDAQK